MIFDAARNYYRRLRARHSWERQWRQPDYHPPWLADAPRPFVLTGFDHGWLAPGLTVLEIGCGRGTTAVWLAQRGLHVLAIDFSSHVIAQAREKFPDQPGVVFQCADACDPSAFTNVFDIIIDTGCLQHVPVRLRGGYCANLLARSRGGSRFVVSMHKVDNTASERLAEVQALFSSHFELVHIEEVPPANSNKFSHLNSVFHFIRR